jgi:hypothetical protein
VERGRTINLGYVYVGFLADKGSDGRPVALHDRIRNLAARSGRNP